MVHKITNRRATFALFYSRMLVIKLQSSDGEIFEVEVDIAKASNTIKTMIEGKKLNYMYVKS